MTISWERTYINKCSTHESTRTSQNPTVGFSRLLTHLIFTTHDTTFFPWCQCNNFVIHKCHQYVACIQPEFVSVHQPWHPVGCCLYLLHVAGVCVWARNVTWLEVVLCLLHVAEVCLWADLHHRCWHVNIKWVQPTKLSELNENDSKRRICKTRSGNTITQLCNTFTYNLQQSLHTKCT